MEYYNPSYTLINMSALSEEICEDIINRLDVAPFTDVEFDTDPDDPAKVMPSNDEDNDRLKYQDHHGRELYCIGFSNPDFEEIEDMLIPVLPKTEDFGQITYMSIIAYPEGTQMPVHKDSADAMDTGTVVFNLNAGFDGGDFTLDGHLIKPFIGQMVAFNNSTERFHGVLPVLGGERVSLCLWFTRPADPNQDLPDYPDEVLRAEMPGPVNDNEEMEPKKVHKSFVIKT